MLNDSRRLVGIDVLRAFAVIGVIGAHLHEIVLPHGALEQAAWNLARGGYLGVDLFFAISGFVITRTVIERDGDLRQMRVGAFYARRIARIWPALILSLALGIAALLMISRASTANILVFFGVTPFTPLFWLSIATFTFNFVNFYHHGWGLHWTVLWSLSVEEQFYLFFPLFMRLATRRRLLMALFSSIAIGVASRHAIESIPGNGLLLTPCCLDPLAIGVAAALIPRFAIGREWSLRIVVLGLAVMLLAPATGWVAAPLLIAVAAAPIMLCCQNGAVFTHCFWLPLARVGRVSYGMYLFHPLVLWVCLPALRGMAFLPALALFVAGTVLAAEISFALVERPASRWILNHRSAPRTRERFGRDREGRHDHKRRACCDPRERFGLTAFERHKVF